MKKILFSVLVLCSGQLLAQPVINDASGMAAVGYSEPLSTAACLSAGSAGASQTWDFSALSFSVMGNLTVVTPSSTPFTATFPSANWSYSVAGAVYSYFENTSTEMKNLASLISATGGNDDYSANPKTIMQFPCTYLSTFSDTYTEMSTTSTVTVTYDGYGTLIMPTGHTYTNVVRIKESYTGNDDYRWYITSPLMSVAVFDGTNNIMYWVGASGSAIDEQSKANSILVYPNPAIDNVTIGVNANGENLLINIMDTKGAVVKSYSQASVTGWNSIELDITDLVPGVYFVNINSSYSKLIVN